MANSDSKRPDQSAGSAPAERPPADLPRTTHLFWSAHPDFDAQADAPRRQTPAALERLGPPPFSKTRFPFIGFLATIYDHVAGHAVRRTRP